MKDLLIKIVKGLVQLAVTSGLVWVVLPERVIQLEYIEITGILVALICTAKLLKEELTAE